MTRAVRILAACAAAGGLVLAGLVLPFDDFMKLVAAGVLATGGALVLLAHLRSFTPSLALLLVTAVLFPVELVTGQVTETGVGGAISACFALAAALCATWLVRLAVVRRRMALDPSRLVVAAVAFIAVAILSFAVGQFPWFDANAAPMRAQLGGLGLFVLSGGVFLVVGHEVASLQQLRSLTWLFLGTGALALAAMLVPGTEMSAGRLRITTHGSVGSLFFTWLVAMSFSQGVLNRDLAASRRLLIVAVGAVALARSLFLTFSWASGWLPATVALGVVLFFRFPRSVLCGTLLLATPALLASGLAWDSVMERESWSWMTRLEALKVMQQVIERSPWLGLGPANYHYYTPLFSILGYNIRFNSHNNYADLVAQTGLVGLLAFAWFAVEAGRLALRLRARAADPFGRAYAVGVLAGLAGSLVAGLLADWIVPFVYNIGIVGFRSSVLFWFFLGGLLTLRRLAVRPPPEAVPVRPASRDLVPLRA